MDSADLQTLRESIRLGFSLVALRPKAKNPFERNWESAPCMTLAELHDCALAGNNIGVRLGQASAVDGKYLHVIDVDIRDEDERDDAQAALEALFPGHDSCPQVVSGRNTISRHLYFLCPEPFRSKKLAHSENKVAKSGGGFSWSWEIELFGTGKQVVMPPSIHPDSGRTYQWYKDDRPQDVCIQKNIVSAEKVRSWTNQGQIADTDTEKTKPALRMSKKSIRELLDDLDPVAHNDNRDGWMKTGMALHHQFDGQHEGFELWDAYSSRSDRYDPDDQWRVWRSFRGNDSDTYTLASLVVAAQRNRVARKFADLADEGFDDNQTTESAHVAAQADEISLEPVRAKDWTKSLSYDRNGIIPSMSNCITILENDRRTRGVIAYNLMTRRMVARYKPPIRKMKNTASCYQLDSYQWQGNYGPGGKAWEDSHDLGIRFLFECDVDSGGYGMRPTDRDIRGAIDYVSTMNNFHPLREFLDALVWDGIPRMHTLYTRYFGSPDDSYHRDCARLTFLGAVTRAYEPGHKFDFVPILEGPQGIRKSTFIQTLARGFFKELHSMRDRKEAVEAMNGSWVMEVPELSGFSKTQVREVKAFLSTQQDTVRLAYDRRATTYPRACIFMGTTNDQEYLNDTTGARRLWPIQGTLPQIDTDRLARNVDKYWAEAVAEYRRMREKQPYGTLPLYLSGASAAAIAVAIQSDRTAESTHEALAVVIGEWLDQPVRTGFGGQDSGELRQTVTCLEVWTDFFKATLDQYTPIKGTPIGKAIGLLNNWQKFQLPRNPQGLRAKAYRRVNPDKPPFPY